MKTIHQILLLSVIALFFISATVLTDWETWKSEDGKMRINYPKSWNFNDAFPGTIFSIKTERTDANDFFREFLVLIVEDVAEGTTLEQYVQDFVKGSMNGFSDVQLISEGATTVGANQAYEVVKSGKQAIFELQTRQIFFIKNNKAYSLAYTAEKINYNTYLEEVDAMIASFEVE